LTVDCLVIKVWLSKSGDSGVLGEFRMQSKLTERQQQVLRATVHRYIATAEPVGSKTLAEEYKLSVSSATIRNIMAVLEKSGLLYQPHTSAGRVPSDFGYRIYVDDLLTPDPGQGLQIEQLLVERLNPGGWSLEAVLRGAAQILSMLSGYITLITLPQAVNSTIRCLQLVRVEQNRLMLIVVTDNYQTQSALMDLPQTELDTNDPRTEEMVERELQVLVNFLNHHLQGRTLNDLNQLDWRSLDQEFQRYSSLLYNLLSDLARRSQPHRSPQMLIGGLSQLFNQPEFAEPQQLHTLLSLLEGQQDQIWPLLGEATMLTGNSTDLNQPKVKVWIGTENPLEPMHSCALVSSSYQRGNSAIGSVGILGPTRMTYDKVIPLVEATAEYLSDTLYPTAN
jgi:heat-inducible transcriptional repressor